MVLPKTTSKSIYGEFQIIIIQNTKGFAGFAPAKTANPTFLGHQKALTQLVPLKTTSKSIYGEFQIIIIQNTKGFAGFAGFDVQSPPFQGPMKGGPCTLKLAKIQVFPPKF